MNIRTQILIIAVTLLAMLYIINKIRKRGIELRYSLLWLLLGIGIIVFACFPGISKCIAGMMGIYQPMNMLFFAGFCFMLPILFSLSVAVSKLSNKVKQLTQEMGLLYKELEKESDNNKDEDKLEEM